MRLKPRSVRFVAIWIVLLVTPAAAAPEVFHFCVLGDRTGEAQPGVYEQAWKEAVGEDPAFVVAVGDTIEGLEDATAEGEWKTVEQILHPYGRYPLYLAPGNHDVWSKASEVLFRKHAGHEPHYSFDYRHAHFTILDNSRSEAFSPEELTFLDGDLKAHAAQPVKLIVSHRPSWLLNVLLRNPDFPLHQLAKKYGVHTVIAGHVHEMLHVDLDGVTYISMPSSGGHLRGTKRYEDGWFFGYALVEVGGPGVRFQIKELKPPQGQGRVTGLEDWGAAGLAAKNSPAAGSYCRPNPMLLTQITLMGVRSNFSRTMLSFRGSNDLDPPF